MKLISNSIQPGAPIGPRFAFGRTDPYAKMVLSDNLNPHLAWSDVPPDARSLALLCVDPDVPSVGDDVNQEGRSIPADLPRVDFYHWVMVDIPVVAEEVNEGDCSSAVTPGGKDHPMGPPGSRQGLNDYTNFFKGNADLEGDYFGYDGPCPPWNDLRLHHYHFRLYALSVAELSVPERFDGRDAVLAMGDHILAQAEIMGVYSLNPEVGVD